MPALDGAKGWAIHWGCLGGGINDQVYLGVVAVRRTDSE